MYLAPYPGKNDGVVNQIVLFYNVAIVEMLVDLMENIERIKLK